MLRGCDPGVFAHLGVDWHGAAALSWRASKALPKGVYLTWKVRGSNSSGIGSFSTALKFKIT